VTDTPATNGSVPGRLKIALISDCYVPRLGGIEMQVHDLARHLQLAGHDVVVLTTTPGPAVVDGVRVHRINVPLLPFDIPFTRKAFREVARLLADEQVDVAQFHGGVLSPLSYVGARAAQKAGLPTVITVHCIWSYATPLFIGLNALTGWGKWPVVLSAVSEVAVGPLRRRARKGSQVVVLPNGIENDAWKIEPIPHDPSVVRFVSVMRLAPRKRPMHLLRMIDQVVDRLPEGQLVEMIIIGDGPELTQLEKYVRAHGLTEVVKLVGRRTREEIRDLFARSDVFVAPANLESFGIAALEARCAGLPVVAKSRTGIREFVRHEQEGLLAESDEDMVEQLTRIVLDSTLRDRMTAHNRSTRSPVDWSDVIDRNVDAYRLAISLRSSG
jgi:glycosyltransferase involved in cell wall biosynthesis